MSAPGAIADHLQSVDRRPRWVRKRHSTMLLARSAPEGEADEIAMKPDIDTRRSDVGGKADVPATWPESPLLATAVFQRCGIIGP